MNLEQSLRETRIAGDVNTPRASNTDHARQFAEGNPYHLFGLPPLRAWSYEQVVALMAEKVGIDPDPDRTTGADTIDPALTAAALHRLRDHLWRFAASGGSVLLATAHPTGLLEIHLALARLLRDAGATLLRPAVGASVVVDPDPRMSPLHLRYVGHVGVYSGWGGLHHSHSSEGMTAMLDELHADGIRPDLVIADHGFAGAAAADGLDVLSFADSNDPGLFVGEAEGRIRVTVPLDDNVQPHLYGPVVDFLTTNPGT